MEIVKNRYGVERVIEKIDSNRIRVMGESLITRAQKMKMVIKQCLILKGALVLMLVVISNIKGLILK